MRCLIAGGGIGGMAIAAALLKEGFDPLVLEQAPSLQPVGAGVNLTPNAMKALAYIGADAYVRETGVESSGFVGIDLDSGENLFEHKMDERARQAYGERIYSTYRPDLIEALKRLVPESHIRLASPVVNVSQTTTGVTAQLKSGETVEGDILIGADGLHSTVRERLFGTQPARFTGYAAWRALIPAATAPKIKFDSLTRTYMGDGRHIIFFPIRKGTIFNFVGFVPQADMPREVWNIARDVSELRASFPNACEEVRDILAAIEKTFITGIYFRDPLPAWTDNRITLLGDAAHPVPPSAAQGASLALEDAVTLAICMRRSAAGNFAAAFDDYQRRRIPATTRTLIQSRSNLRLYNESNPLQKQARRGFYQGLAQLDPIADSMRGWMYRHDPVASAEKPFGTIERENAVANPLRGAEARAAFDAWRNVLTLEDNADGWIGQRAGYERFAAREFRPADHVTVARIDCNGVPALRVCPHGRDGGPAVLYLHGGGYTMGSAQSAVEIAARLAESVGGWALVPDYRLAPEYPFPAAVEDATSAYQWLADNSPAPIFIAGDDAGGGLTISVALEAPRLKLRPPAGLYAISPFADLSVSSDSVRDFGAADPWNKSNTLMLFAARYIQNTSANDPLVSVIQADLSGLPPLLIHAAANEALCDDAIRLADIAKKAGVQTTLRLFDDTVHSFVLFNRVPETRIAAQEWTAFVKVQTAREKS